MKMSASLDKRNLLFKHFEILNIYLNSIWYWERERERERDASDKFETKNLEFWHVLTLINRGGELQFKVRMFHIPNPLTWRVSRKKEFTIFPPLCIMFVMLCVWILCFSLKCLPTSPPPYHLAAKGLLGSARSYISFLLFFVRWIWQAFKSY